MVLISLSYYLCDFVVRDIKIAVYLESPRKINFNLVSEISQKAGFNYLNNKKSKDYKRLLFCCNR